MDDRLILARLELAELARLVELRQRRQIRITSRAQTFLADPSRPAYFVAPLSEDAEDDELASLEALPPDGTWWRRDDPPDDTGRVG